MKRTYLLAAFCACLAVSFTTFGQGSIVIVDPTADTSTEIVEDSKYKLLPGDQSLLDTQVLPKVRKKLSGEGCDEEIVISGYHEGYFTQSREPENMIFYQFCQTGNGMGKAGVATFIGERLTGNFVAESAGWTVDSSVLPDINKNGLDEIALYYSGGMHQGEGGTGCDIVEFSAGKLKGIGWFQSDGFVADGPSWSMKVTVKPGKVPIFFKEKFLTNASGKWRRSGKVLPLKLGTIIGPFITI